MMLSTNRVSCAIRPHLWNCFHTRLRSIMWYHWYWYLPTFVLKVKSNFEPLIININHMVMTDDLNLFWYVCMCNWAKLWIAHENIFVVRDRCYCSVYFYPLYTELVIFVPPFCDHKTGQVAVEGTKETERLPWTFKSGTKYVQISPWTPWSPWRSEHAQNIRTKVKEFVARRSLRGGRRKAHVSPWSQNGCTGVGHWSPRKKMHEPPLHKAATFVPPLSDPKMTRTLNGRLNPENLVSV